MKDLKRKADILEDVAVSLLVATTVIVLFIQIISRYVFDHSFAWTEELARFSFIWMVYLSSSLAVREGTHVRVTAQFLILPKKIRKHSFILADSMWFFLNVIIIVEGLKLFSQMIEFPYMSAVLGINLAWIYLIVPLTFTLQFIRMVEIYYLFFRHGRKIPGTEDLHVD
jgi:C4-dicarboxylate transporter, DctQ subunit